MQNFHVGFFIDGFTLKKVNEYYRYYHPYRSRIDFKGLKNWAKSAALKTFCPEAPMSWESHYYHPYRDPMKRSWHSPGILRFEQQISDAGIQVHYSEIQNDYSCRPNMSLMEDAVIFSSYSKVNAIVLLSTQGQYQSLPERVGRYKVPVLLLGWNFIYNKGEDCVRWRTDSKLRTRASYYVAMDKVIDNVSLHDSLCRGIFQNEKHLVKNLICNGNADNVTNNLCPDFKMRRPASALWIS